VISDLMVWAVSVLIVALAGRGTQPLPKLAELDTLSAKRGAFVRSHSSEDLNSPAFNQRLRLSLPAAAYSPLSSALSAVSTRRLVYLRVGRRGQEAWRG